MVLDKSDIKRSSSQCGGACALLLTMSLMLFTPRSFRMLCTEVYSRQSSGYPSALLASTVSYPSSCSRSNKLYDLFKQWTMA